MSNKLRDHLNAILLRNLLVNHEECPDGILLPKNEEEWGSFIDMSYRNRLVTLLYHFVICKTCFKNTPKETKNLIQKYYIETIIRYKNYRNVKNKIKRFIKNTGTQLILIKDLDRKNLKYYPPYYIPLKFDIDILGQYKDLEKFRKFIGKIGYDPIGYHYGWPDKPIPQYKFSLEDSKSLFPQIEFRYKAFTIYLTKKNILISENIDRFTQEIYKNSTFPCGDFTILSPEYQFIHHALIAYFEDNCRGLNNLFRAWVLYNYGKDIIDWKVVDTIAKRYNIQNVISFVLFLIGKEFQSCDTDLGDRLISYQEYQKLALRLINSEYICRTKLSNGKDFANWKDGYIHFLTRGLLADEPFWRKIIFFTHPKRLLFLFWELIS